MFILLLYLKNKQIITHRPGEGKRGSAISCDEDLCLNPTENLCPLPPVIEISPVSSICTEDSGTSRQGERSRGLLARNSTISEAGGLFLDSLCQQDLMRHSL